MNNSGSGNKAVAAQVQALPNNSPITANNQYNSKADPNCPIKAKKKKTGGKQLYHLPGDLSYKRIKADLCFKTEEEAQSAGFIKSPM